MWYFVLLQVVLVQQWWYVVLHIIVHINVFLLSTFMFTGKIYLPALPLMFLGPVDWAAARITWQWSWDRSGILLNMWQIKVIANQIIERCNKIVNEIPTLGNMTIINKHHYHQYTRPRVKPPSWKLASGGLMTN